MAWISSFQVGEQSSWETLVYLETGYDTRWYMLATFLPFHPLVNDVSNFRNSAALLRLYRVCDIGHDKKLVSSIGVGKIFNARIFLSNELNTFEYSMFIYLFIYLILFCVFSSACKKKKKYASNVFLKYYFSGIIWIYINIYE